MNTYRVGEGQSPSGKILDKETKWFSDFNSAKAYAMETGKKLYVSHNHSKYREIVWKD
jgi:hypothetical protein